MPAVAVREDLEPQPAAQCLSAGDLPKQVKVKKLAKLKTLDTKPGKSLSDIASLEALQECKHGIRYSLRLHRWTFWRQHLLAVDVHTAASPS